MNGGLKILIARMETHPEEFEAEGKWISSFNNYKKYMTEEEKDVFWKKLCELKMNEFEQKIVKRLMQDETPVQQEIDFNKTNTQHQTHVQAHLNSLQQLHDAKLMQATKNDLNDLLLSSNGSSVTYTSAPLVNKKPTIFGKLFNYT